MDVSVLWSDDVPKRIESNLNSIFKKKSMNPFAKSSVNEKRFVELCVHWIAQYLRPLQIVEDIGYRDIINQLLPRYHHITAGVVKRHIAAQCSAIDICMTNKLMNVTFVPLVGKWTCGLMNP